ncbi:sugar phosphate isomerase/epimerase family protein [Bacteroidota bacterium]
MTKNKLNFSCADFTFPLLPHNKSLQLIKLLGIDAVDLGVFEGRSHLSPSEIAKNPIKAANNLRDELKKLELEPADVFLQTGPEPTIAAANTPDTATRENNRYIFQKMLEFTDALGCKHITGLPGVLHENVPFEEDWKKSCEETLWRIEKAKAHNITYAVEPHVGSILPNVQSVIKYIRDAPGTTLTLDYGHFIYQGEANESIHTLIPFASHFHARGGTKGQLQTTVKENSIDFKTIVSEFKRIGYKNWICLEYVYIDWEGCNETDNLSETIRLRKLLQTVN